jgi:SAM-dependent methyltransferase
MTAEGLAANADRFSGFADLYDDARPTPPAELAPLLTSYAEVERPALVVDLGSGTGLSTRWCAGWADRVVGVEPNHDMRLHAASRELPNVEFVEGYSHATGLPSGCADLVLAVQALHWMDPVATFAEVARVLRPGGVFAAVDCDWPPSVGNAHAEAAWERARATCKRGEDGLAAGLEGAALVASLDGAPAFVERERFNRDDEQHRRVGIGVRRWAKDGHLRRMHESERFRWTREVVLHTVEPGDAERFVDLLRSQGDLQTLLKHGVTEEQLGVTACLDECVAAIGTAPRDILFTYRVRLGVT